MIIRHPYTLLEMIAATAVIMMVVGVATVNFSNLRLDKSPDELTEELRRMGALCRRYAIAQGKPQEVFYYHKKRIIKFDKESIYLPEETKLSVNGVEPEEDLMCMKFFPDGNAAVSTIEFAAGEDVAGVRVSPLTGVLSSYENE